MPISDSVWAEWTFEARAGLHYKRLASLTFSNPLFMPILDSVLAGWTFESRAGLHCNMIFGAKGH